MEKTRRRRTALFLVPALILPLVPAVAVAALWGFTQDALYGTRLGDVRITVKGTQTTFESDPGGAFSVESNAAGMSGPPKSLPSFSLTYDPAGRCLRWSSDGARTVLTLRDLRGRSVRSSQPDGSNALSVAGIGSGCYVLGDRSGAGCFCSTVFFHPCAGVSCAAAAPASGPALAKTPAAAEVVAAFEKTGYEALESSPPAGDEPWVVRLRPVPPEVGTAAGREAMKGSWTKHTIGSGVQYRSAATADFNGDQHADVMAVANGSVHLWTGPSWGERIFNIPGDMYTCHVIDANKDGRMDFLGAQYGGPAKIFWLEQPTSPSGEWVYHLIDDSLNGTHGLQVGDIDGDGGDDLVANSAEDNGTVFLTSLVWYKIPDDPTKPWIRHVLADQDAPGLTHYHGIGDANADGRPDVASAAKGVPSDKGDWFAWWKAPEDFDGPWEKHLIAENEIGATNIYPVDVDLDGDIDFVASRGHGTGVVWFEAPDWTPHQIDTELEEPHDLVVADLDYDGDVDAASRAEKGTGAAWYENDGSGNFAKHLIGNDGGAYDIRAADLDGDGDLDLVVAGMASNRVDWYENPLQ